MFLCLFLSGCGVLWGTEQRVIGNCAPYAATKSEATMASENLNSDFWFPAAVPFGVVACIDAPITLAYDTAMLPLDLTVFSCWHSFLK